MRHRIFECVILPSRTPFPSIDLRNGRAGRGPGGSQCQKPLQNMETNILFCRVNPPGGGWGVVTSLAMHIPSVLQSKFNSNSAMPIHNTSSFPNTANCRSQEGPFLVFQKDHSSFSRRTMCRPQEGRFVALGKDDSSFPHKTMRRNSFPKT